ncbi:hypothetical protein V493_01736 [Pseudogymnoascus sp. VKM F-4281 (FW-2241)]|nr:hypothetical protein V493_01736 [Pseudogymnoascus sp. VKM F-4281 (FW-2241)]
MDSLRPHTYNKTTKEVLFTNSRVVLNIHDAVSSVSTDFVDWRRLFSCPEDSLRSAYLYQQDHHYALRPIHIEDATRAKAKISDVTIESLTLRLARKTPEELEKLGSKSYFGTDGLGRSQMGGILEQTNPQIRENCPWWTAPITSQPHRLSRIVEE